METSEQPRGVPHGLAEGSIVFGEQTTGRIIHVNDTLNGLACACVCPSCRAPLVAKQGQILPWHFAHATGTECATAGETALHRAAKQILIEALAFAVPDGYVDQVWDNTHQHYRVVASEQPKWVRGQVEVDYGAYRPDAVLTDAHERQVGVEIRVTSKVDAKKARQIEQDGRLSVVEVDLSRCPRLISWAALADMVTRSAPRHWAYSRRVAEVHAAMAQIHANRGPSPCVFCRRYQADWTGQTYTADDIASVFAGYVRTVCGMATLADLDAWVEAPVRWWAGPGRADRHEFLPVPGHLMSPYEDGLVRFVQGMLKASPSWPARSRARAAFLLYCQHRLTGCHAADYAQLRERYEIPEEAPS